MSFSSVFKNVGHAFASVGKAIATGVKDVVQVAAKAQQVEPEVAALIAVLAGPTAAKYSSLAFHGFGDLAAAIEKLGPEAEQVGAVPLNLTLDAQFVADVKAAAAEIRAIAGAIKTPIPAA